MPLQNRVDPYGTIFRTSARGTIMGNRGGAIHNEHREIVRPFLNRRWIACVLEFRGRQRTVMMPGRYTELFFLDEAVSFAAGHRPCAECRRQRFNAFRDAWARWDNQRPEGPLRANYMDEILHRTRCRIRWEAPIDTLPGGSFVEIDGAPWVVAGDSLARWTPEGYTERHVRPKGSAVSVLTPQPSVRCFREGYTPIVHESAKA
jgi:hypothetical protein